MKILLNKLLSASNLTLYDGELGRLKNEKQTYT